MLAIFGALPDEISYLKRIVTVTRSTSSGTCRVVESALGKVNVLLVLTGVGKDNAKHAADYVTGKYETNVIISTGFCGSLNEKAVSGNFALYSAITCDSDCDTDRNGVKIDPLLEEAARLALKTSACSYISGKGISVTNVCATPESKNRLRESSGCDFVDMESYWIGKIAGDRNIPFYTVRLVFDALNDDLSVIDHIMRHGKVDLFKTSQYILFHPGKIRTLSRYVSIYRTTQKRMLVFIQNFIKELGNRTGELDK